jgi:hypothetical protein
MRSSPERGLDGLEVGPPPHSQGVLLCGITRIALRVDGQPRLPFSAEDVGCMEVSVHHQMRLDPPNLMESSGGGLDRPARQVVSSNAGIRAELRDRVQAVVYAYEHSLVRPGSRP